MYPKSIELINIGLFEKFGKELKPLNIFRGPNGSGKSTICNAIKYLAESSHDPTLIRNYGTPAAAEFGAIRLTIGDPSSEFDGAEFIAKIQPEKTTRILMHPKLGKIPVAQSKAWIQNAINMLSLDPIRFLTAESKEQVKIFLQSQPIHLKPEQLVFLPEDVTKDVNYQQHALIVIGDKDQGIFSTLYQRRSTLNKEIDIKRGYSLELKKTLPAKAPEGGWDEIFKKKSAELSKLKTDAVTKSQQIRQDARDATEAQGRICNEQKRIISKQLEDQIDELTSICVKKQKDLDEARDAELKRINDNFSAAMEDAQKEYQPKVESLTAEISTAYAKNESHIAADATYKLITRTEQEIDETKAEANSLSKNLKELEELKAGLLKETPISGLEVSENALVLDGVPLKRVNDAKKTIRVAIQIAKMQAGPLGLVVMDNCEKFDENSLPLFEDIAKELGIRIIMTIATTRDEQGNKIDGLNLETMGE